MKKRPVFDRSFTPEELDRCPGAKRHPVTGSSSDLKHYWEEKGVYLKKIRVGCSNESCSQGSYAYEMLQRIGDRRPKEAGDRYPGHWKYDPWTGEYLYTDDGIDATW